MFESFTKWHNEHQTEISWFFIGLFTINLIRALETQQYFWALVDIVFIIWNYKVYKESR